MRCPLHKIVHTINVYSRSFSVNIMHKHKNVDSKATSANLFLDKDSFIVYNNEGSLGHPSKLHISGAINHLSS